MSRTEAQENSVNYIDFQANWTCLPIPCLKKFLTEINILVKYIYNHEKLIFNVFGDLDTLLCFYWTFLCPLPVLQTPDPYLTENLCHSWVEHLLNYVGNTNVETIFSSWLPALTKFLEQVFGFSFTLEESIMCALILVCDNKKYIYNKCNGFFWKCIPFPNHFIDAKVTIDAH